jgi:hypothetical protein
MHRARDRALAQAELCAIQAPGEQAVLARAGELEQLRHVGGGRGGRPARAAPS